MPSSHTGRRRRAAGVIAAATACALGLGLAAAPPAAAAPDATWYLVHAVPGADVQGVSAGHRNPLDIEDGGRCTSRGDFFFGDIAGPFAIYSSRGGSEFPVEIHFKAADARNPCGGPLLNFVKTTVRAAPRAIVLAVRPGSFGASTFVLDMDLSPVPEGRARLNVAHVADAPVVSVVTVDEAGEVDATGLAGIGRGSEKRAPRAPGTYQVYVYAGATPTGEPLAGPVDVEVPEGSVVQVYVVGSVNTQQFYKSLTIISRQLG